MPVKENQLLTYTEIKEYFDDDELYKEAKKNIRKLYLKSIMEL